MSSPTWYACRKCRTKLFTESDIAPHSPGEGQNSFSWNKRKHNTNEVVCSSYFLEERMAWMGELDDMEGRLFCSSCHGVVGSFTWHGAQCSCGHWCTPALQILQSRVDKVGAVAKEIMLPNVSVVVPKIPDEPVLETVNISEAELNDFV